MELESVKKEPEAEVELDENKAIRERASGILDTIDALINIANGSAEDSEILKAEKQAAESEPKQIELTQELVQTMITSAVTVLKMEVRSMIRDAVANLPQTQQEEHPLADGLTDRQLAGEDPY